MTTKRPQLYPQHQHQWKDHPLNRLQVVCTICGFDPPRRLAQLDKPQKPGPVE